MKQRFQRHLLANLVGLGDRTITGLLCTAGRQFDDWTADYRMYSRQRIDPSALFATIRSAVLDSLPETAPAVVALDDTHIRKTGLKIDGVKYRRDPLGPPFQVNFILAQRFLQLSLASGPDRSPRMVPAAWQHAPSPPKPKPKAPESEWKQYRQVRRQQSLGVVAVEQLRLFRQWMDDNGHQQRSLWAVVDGGYTNGTVLKNLPPNTELIGRTRSDAKLYFLPEESAMHAGRPRVYGQQAPTPEQLRQDDTAPWQQVTVWIHGEQCTLRAKSLGPLRWRAAGAKHTFKLVVVAGVLYRVAPNGKRYYRPPAYLLCTNPAADTITILQRYLRRWDIEVNFRDQKTLLGVGEAQVRDPNAVQNVTATSVASYALLLAAAEKITQTGEEPLSLPRPKWQRKKPPRTTTQQLIQQMRCELWGRAMNFSHFVKTSAPAQPQINSLHSPQSALLYGSRYS